MAAIEARMRLARSAVSPTVVGGLAARFGNGGESYQMHASSSPPCLGRRLEMWGGGGVGRRALFNVDQNARAEIIAASRRMPISRRRQASSCAAYVRM